MNMESPRQSVTSAEFVRQFGMWQDRAATRPIYVTHHGRERLVVLSLANYQQLSQRASHSDRSFVVPNTVQLGAVLERLAQGFVAVDNDFCVTDLNPAAASYLKVARGSATGRSLGDLFPSINRTLLYTHIVRAVQSGETAIFEQPSFTFEGRWLSFETMPYLNGAAVLFRDVTAERQARDAAELDSATAQATEVHGRVGRGRLSSRGTIAMVDAVLARMAGFEPESLVRARLTDILPLSRRVDAAHEIEAVLSGGPPASFRTALLVNRGGELPVRVSLAELRRDQINDGAVVVVTPD